jgi:hypothetical protein
MWADTLGSGLAQELDYQQVTLLDSACVCTMHIHELPKRVDER